MKMLPLIIALGALTWVAAATADQPIYKWVDDKGQVHYSTEPHSGNAKQLGITTSTPAEATAPAPTGATAAKATYADDASLTQAQPADSPACKAGRDRLFKYLHADNLYSLDAQGNKVTLSKEDRDKALDDARNYVRQACSAGGGQ